MGYRGIGETARVSALDGDEDGHAMNGGRQSMGSDSEATAMITQDIGDEEHEEFEFSEVMIHQTIHTIGESTRSLTVFGVFLADNSLQNSVSTVFPIRLLISAYGLYRLRISSFRLSYGL